MIKYKCEINIRQGDDGIQKLRIWVISNGQWEVIYPEGWCPSSGPWDASDLVGRGGCVCFGGGPKRPPILKLNDFKPYGYQRYRVGKVGEGKGIFISPVMPVGSKDFDWEIVSIEGEVRDENEQNDYDEVPQNAGWPGWW
jgi:hypothetical protein